MNLKQQLKQMALTPKVQLKKLLTGTLGALVCLLTLILTSHFTNQWLFYGLSVMMGLFILYAIPGYIGIWAWRMKRLILDQD